MATSTSEDMKTCIIISSVKDSDSLKDVCGCVRSLNATFGESFRLTKNPKINVFIET